MIDMADDDMMWDSRTRRLLGDEAVRRLHEAKVIVVGTGGVGGYAVEMLARCGIGCIGIMDADTVAISNLNRQLIALRPDIGVSKVALFARRIADINPDTRVCAYEEYLTPDRVPSLLTDDNGQPLYDVVIDAIDTVAPKVALIAFCQTHRLPVFSSMGAGGRLDPSKIEMTDLWKTAGDGLARAVRQGLKKLGIHRPLRVVASSEVPRSHSVVMLNQANKRSSYGTLATIPSVFGIYLASAAIDTILKRQKPVPNGQPTP